MRILRIAAAGLMVVSAYGQSGQGGQGRPAPPPLFPDPMQAPGMPSRPGTSGPDDPLPGRTREQLAITRNIERQKKLADDTAKLLALATELKQQVDKTDKNIMSVDVIKKADEIERLAKSVKDRMKGSGA